MEFLKIARRQEQGASSQDAHEVVFYDGRCGLCHWFARFTVRVDGRGVFRFAPIGGRRFQADVPLGDRASLPDSVVVRDSSGALFVRSAAVLHVLEQSGGVWRVLAFALRIVPGGLRDRVYDRVARVRGRLFRTPPTTCPVLPLHLRSRFDQSDEIT